jgi:hypothetical protein
MLDARVRAVLERLEAEDADERARGLPASQRSRQVARTTGQFLFSLVAPQTDCEVLEIGGSRGYSTLWLAAGVRYLGGRVLSLEHDPAKCAAWRRNVDDAGLGGWAQLVEGDAFETLPGIDDVFDVVFLDAEKDDTSSSSRSPARSWSRARSWSPTTSSRTPTPWRSTQPPAKPTQPWRASQFPWTAAWSCQSSSQATSSSRANRGRRGGPPPREGVAR